MLTNWLNWARINDQSTKKDEAYKQDLCDEGNRNKAVGLSMLFPCAISKTCTK